VAVVGLVEVYEGQTGGGAQADVITPSSSLHPPQLTMKEFMTWASAFGWETTLPCTVTKAKFELLGSNLVNSRFDRRTMNIALTAGLSL
jgi:hypothetical protein